MDRSSRDTGENGHPLFPWQRPKFGPVLLVGERHAYGDPQEKGPHDYQELLLKQLPQLYANKMRGIALELPPEFQPYVDRILNLYENYDRLPKEKQDEIEKEVGKIRREIGSLGDYHIGINKEYKDILKAVSRWNAGRKEKVSVFCIDAPLADQFKAIDEDQLYIKIKLPEELQPEVDRYRQRIKDLPLEERRVLRAQFKSDLMEYCEKENKELFDQRKDEISQRLEEFLNIFDHVPPPDMDRHKPDKNTPLQEVEIHHPLRIYCVGFLPFRYWTQEDLKYFCAEQGGFFTPEYISQRDKVMGWNLYEVAKNNLRSLTLSYNGALHFSKNLGGLPRETTLAEELDGYGIKFKLAGRSPQECRVIWNGKTYEEKAKEMGEQASLLEEGLEAKNKESYLNLNLYQDKQRYLSLDLDRYRQRDRGGYGR